MTAAAAIGPIRRINENGGICLGGRNDKIGAIAPGKWADLLVLDANPLQDIRNTHKIAAVYIAGNKTPSIPGE